MHTEIDKLIEMAIADGHVTDKEREIILRKAEKLGIDMDEMEMYLEGKLTTNNYTTSHEKKIVSLNINKSKSDLIVKNNFKSRKVKSIKVAILDSENALKLEIANFKKDIEKLNDEKKTLLDKKSEFKSKLEISTNFLKNQKVNISSHIVELKNELNNNKNDFFVKINEELCIKISEKKGESKVIINNLSDRIEFNKNDIIKFITYNGIIKINEIIKKRKLKRYFFVIIGFVSMLYLLINNYYFLSWLSLLFFLLISSFYSESLNRFRITFSSTEFKLILKDVIENNSNQIEIMSILNNKIRSLESMQKKINTIIK
jgi:hypothetical protein